jgi:hypothetical protein
MPKLSGTAALPFWLLCLSGCTTVDTAPQQVAVFRYQHVANAHRVHFSNPVALPRRPVPVDFVTPLDAYGFWAIFVVCSVDTRPSVLPSFRYNVNDFRVQYRGQAFGPLRPYTLRYQGSTDLNAPRDSAAIAEAIRAEIHEGPASAVFGHDFYPGLNYRFAIYVPRALPDYAGEPLELSYAGQPAVLASNGYPPSDLDAVGANGAGMAASCLP